MEPGVRFILGLGFLALVFIAIVALFYFTYAPQAAPEEEPVPNGQLQVETTTVI